MLYRRPQNGGSEGQKRTKTSILCSRREDIGIGKRNCCLPANHRAQECALEVPRTRICVLGELLERRTWPSDSLIRRRYGGGVGNRCRWVDRFALSEQRQFSEQAFPAESGTLPHRPWAPMPLVNGRGPASEALREG